LQNSVAAAVAAASSLGLCSRSFVLVIVATRLPKAVATTTFDSFWNKLTRAQNKAAITLFICTFSDPIKDSSTENELLFDQANETIY
jgi:hypothetical protein